MDWDPIIKRKSKRFNPLHFLRSNSSEKKFCYNLIQALVIHFIFTFSHVPWLISLGKSDLELPFQFQNISKLVSMITTFYGLKIFLFTNLIPLPPHSCIFLRDRWLEAIRNIMKHYRKSSRGNEGRKKKTELVIRINSIVS